MSEPTWDALGGTGGLPRLRRLVLATRPKFFTASVLPVLLGTAYGAGAAGVFQIPAFLLSLAAIVLLHGGVNVLNDVYDEISGNDRANTDLIYPYSGGSRFIQNEVIGLAAMTRLGWGLLVAGVAVGVALAALVGWEVMWFGLAGVALGVFYSAPPMWLSARGLGELAVGIGFGILPVTGAAWVQAGTVDDVALVLSVPVAFWISNVLLINEVPDTLADASVGRRTLAVVLGRKGTARLYAWSGLGALAAIVGAAAYGMVPLWAVAGPVALLVLGYRGFRGILSPDHDNLKRGIEATLGVHALGTIWLVIVVVFGLS